MHGFKVYTEELTKNQRKRKESYQLRYIRQGKMGILRIRPIKSRKFVEVRGKIGFEVNFDENDYLHRTMRLIGKGVNVSELVNGEEVILYDRGDSEAKRAMKVIQAIVRYPDVQHW